MVAIDDDFEDLGKDSDYLEDLARILENLGGLDTLVQELIQNADDAGASRMTFDIGKDALVVDNDATFSDCGDQRARTCRWRAAGDKPCDLHAFRRLSGASKRGRLGTTGAFGIGFTAVYQITDRPELISAGSHVAIDETQDAQKRARRCRGRSCGLDHGRPGTRFILPWARDEDSDLRTALRVSAVSDETAAELDAGLESTIPRAMLFLRHVERIEVRSEGTVARVYERRIEDGRLEILGASQPREYVLLKARFSSAAEQLQQQHPAVISGREVGVAVAIPLHGPEPGLIYAGLPTHDESGFPFHINADFFPADDRRSLRWNTAPHAAWNREALKAAGWAVGHGVIAWRDAVGAERLWSSLRLASRARGSGPDARGQALAALWESLRAKAAQAAIVRTTTGGWTTPALARRVPATVEIDAYPILAELGLALVDAVIASDVAQLQPHINVPLLAFAEAVDAAARALPADAICAPEDLPAPFSDIRARETLLAALMRLHSAAPGDAATERLQALTLAPEATGFVGPLYQLWRCAPPDRELFWTLDPELPFLDTDRFHVITADDPGLSPRWECESAVDHLSELPAEALASASDEALYQLIHWLARHEETIAQRPDLRDAVRALRIWPSARGRTTLEGLTLPSGRLDELPLAETLDLTHLASVRGFLARVLQVETLDLRAYCLHVLPLAFKSDVSPARRKAVVRTLGHIKADLLDDDEVRDTLRKLPLAECHDGSWKSVPEAYWPSDELAALLGPGYPRAAFDPKRRSITRDVLDWLGLGRQPRTKHLLDRIDELTAEDPTSESKAHVHHVLDHLAGRLSEWSEKFLGELRARKWLTADGQPGWHHPTKLLQREYRNIFRSQALVHDAPNERDKSDFLDAIGVDLHPPTPLVTRHLLWHAEHGESAPWRLYEYLETRTDQAELDLLEGQPCIRVSEDSAYARATHVFQTRHPFGGYRWVLPQRLRGLTRLLEALAIAEEPAAEDAIDMLEEIAGRDDITAADESVVHACWRMLQQAMDDGGPLDLSRLGDLDVALDAAGQLAAPVSLVFNDAPTLADRLAARLGARLISRREDTWRALHEAGAQNLSEAVEVEIVGSGEGLDPSSLTNLLHERAGLLGRVVESLSPGAGAAARAHARSLEVDASTELLVAYHLPDEPSDKLHRVRAIYDRDSDVLHVALEDGSLGWTETAKELARALAPEVMPHHIAPTLRCAIEPNTLATAEAELNDLDVPRLDDEQAVQWSEADDDWSAQAADPVGWEDGFEESDDQDASEEADVATVHDDGDADADAGEQPVAEVPSIEGEAKNHRARPADSASAAAGETGDRLAGSEGSLSEAAHRDPAAEVYEEHKGDSGMAATGEESIAGAGGGRAGGGRAAGESAARGRRASERQPRTPGSPLRHGYLETFLVVNPKPSRSAADIASVEERENLAIDRAGTNAVLKHERDRGRDAIRKPHSHRGYDVESLKDGELVRVIEVKSIDGPWDAARARLSAAQFDVAGELGDRYWLYVVENARTTPRIWRIQNPARRADGFAYIPDWKRLAESDADAPPPAEQTED